jgi:hypothetical protein
MKIIIDNIRKKESVNSSILLSALSGVAKVINLRYY